MIRGVQAQGRLREGVLAQFWHSCSPNGDGRDTEPSGSALFVRKLWSHPPGLNRRPTDYESRQMNYGGVGRCRTKLDHLALLQYVRGEKTPGDLDPVGSGLTLVSYSSLYSFLYTKCGI